MKLFGKIGIKVIQNQLPVFSKNETLRYSKQTILSEIGLLGQARLKDAKIAVIGAGGLGCPIIQYLASCGVGNISIIDFDVVEISNLNRQILFAPSDIGKKKGEIARNRALEQNPDIFVEFLDCKINEENVDEILKEYDLVMDGCDNFSTRYIVNDSCLRLGKPLVYGSILGFQGQIAVFNHNGSKNLREIFPSKPNNEDVPACSENGVLGVVPGIVGTLMVNEAIKCIISQPTLHNQFLIIDLLSMNFTKLNF